ncbi:MAG TPA: hypothetical protein VN372_01855 [Methanospirillum sp.]|nr:hypothetical protein [Methanospirillum sp.]
MTRVLWPLCVVLILALWLSCSSVSAVETLSSVPGKSVSNVITFKFDDATTKLVDAARVQGGVYFVPATQSDFGTLFTVDPKILVRGWGMKQRIPITVNGATRQGTYFISFDVIDVNGARVNGPDGKPISVTFEVYVVDRTHTYYDGFYRPDTIVTSGAVKFENGP